MAAVFVPPSPQTAFAMSTRRPPLASVPNATNSPHRASNTASKRPRTGSQLDLAYGQPPPKKQVVDHQDEAVTRSPTKSRTTIPSQTAEAKVFSRRSNNSQPTAFEKKLVAARDKERQTQSKGSRYEKASAETLDTIRQWQKHYRKAFPGFVFYFDSVPADVRSRCVREVLALGAVSAFFCSNFVCPVPPPQPFIFPRMRIYGNFATLCFCGYLSDYMNSSARKGFFLVSSLMLLPLVLFQGLMSPILRRRRRHQAWNSLRLMVRSRQ